MCTECGYLSEVLSARRRQDEFTHPSADIGERLQPSTLRFAPSGRSKQLSALRGRQWTSTTGPGPVVDPYSTHLAKLMQARVVERDRSSARQEADCRTSTVTQAKPWNRWVLMPATCAATGICSIKPYLAQCAVLTTHHHERCGVSASSALKRSKTSRGGVTAACRQASGTSESYHGLGSALSEFGYLQVPPSLPAASRSRPPSCSLAAFSACGGELRGPRATARFVAHVRLLDLSG